MRVGKNEVGGPEKQVILFVRPYTEISDKLWGHLENLYVHV